MHQSTEAILASFHWFNVPEHIGRHIDHTRRLYATMADTVAQTVPEGPELTRALVLLRQSKDAAVISIIQDARQEQQREQK